MSTINFMLVRHRRHTMSGLWKNYVWRVVCVCGLELRRAWEWEKFYLKIRQSKNEGRTVTTTTFCAISEATTEMNLLAATVDCWQPRVAANGICRRHHTHTKWKEKRTWATDAIRFQFYWVQCIRAVCSSEAFSTCIIIISHRCDCQSSHSSQWFVTSAVLFRAK